MDGVPLRGTSARKKTGIWRSPCRLRGLRGRSANLAREHGCLAAMGPPGDSLSPAPPMVANPQVGGGCRARAGLLLPARPPDPPAAAELTALKATVAKLEQSVRREA